MEKDINNEQYKAGLFAVIVLFTKRTQQILDILKGRMIFEYFHIDLFEY